MTCRWIWCFLSLVHTGVLVASISKDVQCGKDISFHISLPNENITDITLKKQVDLLKTTTVSDVCTENGKFCFQVEKDRKNMTLLVKAPTCSDSGKYNLYISFDEVQTETINLHVNGACVPVLSQSGDTLTCSVDVKNGLEIVWMDKHRNIYQKYPYPKSQNVMRLENSLRLTRKTRGVEMCCHVHYMEDGKKAETHNCTGPYTLTPQESHALQDTVQQKQIFIPLVVVVLVLVVGVVFLNYRRQGGPCHQRGRSLSDVTLMGEEAVTSQPLQGSHDTV